MTLSSPSSFALALTLLSGCVSPLTPDAPRVVSLVERTVEDRIFVRGLSEPNAEILVRQEGATSGQSAANDRGEFTVEVSLRPNAMNTLLLYQTVDGQRSPPALATVVHDLTPPRLPTLDPVVTPTRRRYVRIAGVTEPEATVRVEGGLTTGLTTASASGRFEVEVELRRDPSRPVENRLAVSASDDLANSSETVTVSVVQDSMLALEAPLVDETPTHTNQPRVTVSGEAEPGAGVYLAGGRSPLGTVARADGRFEFQAELWPNQLNELRLFAVDDATVSTPAIRRVVHDDRAPAPAELEPHGASTGAETVTLRGEAEPGARVEIGGERVVVGEDRRFALELPLALDADTVLSATVVDLASNRSAARAVTITQSSSLPEPVSLDPLTSPTRALTQTVSGRAEADAVIDITGGANPVSVVADSVGEFTASVELRPGSRNELRVSRAGSGVQAIRVLVHDDVAPAPPTIHPTRTPTDRTTIDVRGTAEPRAQVSIEGGIAPDVTTVGDDGRFHASIAIEANGERTLRLVVIDRAGNASSEATLSVTHDASAGPSATLHVPAPAATSLASFQVVGRVPVPSELSGVAVVPGDVFTRTDVDPFTGGFVADVELEANQTQELAVIAVEDSTGFDATPLTITHDDIAPAAPAVSGLETIAGSGTGTCVGGFVEGVGVEGGARVLAWNVSRGQGEEAASLTTASGLGAFHVGLRSCSGDLVHVRVQDPAGNLSEPVELTAD